MELRTLAESIDAITNGELPEVADLLMQRFKGVERKVITGDWALSNEVELIDQQFRGVTTAEEINLATKALIHQKKLADAQRENKRKH